MLTLTKCYSIIGVQEGCPDSELEEAYRSLKKRYSELRYAPGPEGNDAARKLSELEDAYHELKQARKERADAAQDASVNYSDVEQKVRDGKFDEAQALLDNIQHRDAEWHYQQSIVFYKRNWYLESKRQLELAINADPSCLKYKDALEKMEKIMSNPKTDPGSMRNDQQQQQQDAYGGTEERSCGNSLPACCTALCVADCCCDCIRCC